MKVGKSISFVMIGILFIINENCAQIQATFSDNEAKVALKTFYTSYIKAFLEISSTSERKLNAVKAKYCTAALLKRLPVLAMQADSDPLLKAQDSDTAWLKTLTVDKDLKKSNTYNVSYVDGGNKRIVIRLTLVKQGETVKIASVE